MRLPCVARLLLATCVLAPCLVAAGPAAATTTFGSVGRWITYPDGRVFVPHGFNSVVTEPPYYNAWFGPEDVGFLAREGFTVMRINFLPSALEPTIGAVDPDYLQHFVDRAGLLAGDGFATLVAMNQDRFAASCGGDGFPSWAVLAPCNADIALPPIGPWGAFWADDPATDGVGLQEHYLAWWADAAPRFAALPSVLGFDLLNEPAAPDDVTLAGLWERTMQTIQQAGTAHIAFTEPRDPANPGFGATSFPADSGLAGHVYCDATLQPELAGRAPAPRAIASCIHQDALTLERQVAFARQARLALLVGEFGASDELREQSTLVDAMASAFVPWTVYAYNGKLDGSGAPAQSILRDESKPGSEANAKQAKLDALVVPYPMAIAGTPRSWRFDRAARTVSFSYSTRRVGGGKFVGSPPTVVFIPQRVYRTGYSVRAVGARIESKPTAPWLELVAERGASDVHVTVTPRTGSRTLTPLQVDRCGYDLDPCASS